MLLSRMFTTAFRFFAGLAAFSFVAAFAISVTSESQPLIDRVLGPLTMGWKGGVGNHLGYVLFLGLLGVAAGMAGILIAFRDADPESQVQVLDIESLPLTRAPSGTNYLPALAAFTLVVIVVGLAAKNGALTIGALIALVMTGFVWTLRTWAERATGDASVNAELYHRFVDPLRTPVLSIISVAVVAIGLSRVLLAVSKTNAIVVFSAVATVVFVITVILALRPGSVRSIVRALVVLGAIAVIAAGIIAGIAGEREIEKHGEDHSSMIDTDPIWDRA